MEKYFKGELLSGSDLTDRIMKHKRDVPSLQKYAMKLKHR